MADNESPEDVKETAAETEKPTYVPSTVFEDKIGQLSETVGQLTANISALIQNQAQRGGDAPAPLMDVSEQEYDEAGLSPAASKLFKRQLEVERQKMLKEYILPLRETGLTSLAEIREELSTSKMPYYDVFKKEVDAELKRMDPALRTRKDVVEYVYNTVVGQNVKKVLELEQEKGARQRAAVEATDTARVTSRGTGLKDGEMPSFEDVMGVDAMTALRNRGLTPEKFCASIGTTPEAYIKMAMEQEEANV